MITDDHGSRSLCCTMCLKKRWITRALRLDAISPRDFSDKSLLPLNPQILQLRPQHYVDEPPNNIISSQLHVSASRHLLEKYSRIRLLALKVIRLLSLASSTFFQPLPPLFLFCKRISLRLAHAAPSPRASPAASNTAMTLSCCSIASKIHGEQSKITCCYFQISFITRMFSVWRSLMGWSELRQFCAIASTRGVESDSRGFLAFA